MTKPIAMMMLAAVLQWVTACSSNDDHEPSSDDEESSGSSHDADLRACQEATLTLFERECRPGFTPGMVRADISIAPPRAAEVPICGDIGVLIDFDAVPGAERVGYDITRNSVCAYGCFNRCGLGVNTCAGETATGGLCGSCGAHLDEQSCYEFVAWCQEIDADEVGAGSNACGTQPTGEDDGGGPTDDG